MVICARQPSDIEHDQQPVGSRRSICTAVRSARCTDCASAPRVGKKDQRRGVAVYVSSLIDRIIAALSEEHAALATLVPTLTDDQLAGPSGAGQWPICEVLGHVGSGAEITLAGLYSAIEGRAAPTAQFNGPVWDRWNAMSPDQKRAGYLAHSAALVSAFEALDEQQRNSLEIGVFYMPAPLPVATFAGLRLNESALHGWDVRVGVDPDAELHARSADLLAELLSDQISFMLAFIAKPDRIEQPVVLEIAGSSLAISVTDTVTIGTPTAPATAIFTGPIAAAIRLIEGRLGPDHTPPGVQVTGNATLAELREAFPGF